MTDYESIHPRRPEFDALKESIDQRITTLENMIANHREDSVRRHIQRERAAEGLRDTVEKVVDRVNALILDYEDMKRSTQKRDLDWQEEKGAFIAQMSRQEMAYHERFNRSDLSIVQQNGEIAKINAKLDELQPIVMQFKEAAYIVVEDAKDRKKAEEKTQKAIQKVLMYSKLILAIAGVVGAFVSAVSYVSSHFQVREPPHETARPQSSRLEKIRHYVFSRHYSWSFRAGRQDASIPVLPIA